MKVCMSVGHGKFVRGASASPRPPYLDEVTEAGRVVERVASYWRNAGVSVETFFDTTSRSVSQNLATINRWHNSRARDFDVSCHFNAFQKTSNPRGTEVLYVTQAKLAADTSAAIARAGGFINRGAKKRTNLAFLNGTSKPAILLEVCFVDSEADAKRYTQNFEAICIAIAEAVGKIKVPGQPKAEPPAAPEPQLYPLEPDVTDNNIVAIDIKVTGNVAVSINDDPITENDTPNKLNIFLDHQGDVLVNVNGEDFQIEAGHAIQQND